MPTTQAHQSLTLRALPTSVDSSWPDAYASDTQTLASQPANPLDDFPLKGLSRRDRGFLLLVTAPPNVLIATPGAAVLTAKAVATRRRLATSCSSAQPATRAGKDFPTPPVPRVPPRER
ncbi:hypothetical protein MTO96_031769 [Rhipicephalus appendiculatus]